MFHHMQFELRRLQQFGRLHLNTLHIDYKFNHNLKHCRTISVRLNIIYENNLEPVLHMLIYIIRIFSIC